MITEQIINYIKDQITRGVAREKIMSNLQAAGWVEEDIVEAFSFAQPTGDTNAVIKIAPAFAVEREIPKEEPVNKAEILKEEERASFTPILKKDSEINLNPLRPIEASVETSSAMNTQSVTTVTNSYGANTASSDFVNNTASFNTAFSTRDMVAMKPKPSRFLKLFTLFVFLVFVIGNSVLWFVLYPAYIKNNSHTNTSSTNTMPEQTSRSVEVQTSETAEVKPLDDSTLLALQDEPQNTVNNTAPTIDTKLLLAPATALKQAANVYFTKGNTFGSTPKALTSCSLAGGMFSDNSIKKHVSAMATISGTNPMCALGGEDNSKKSIVTKYLVYVPVGQSSGFCIDNTGAAIMVTSVPESLSCVSAL